MDPTGGKGGGVASYGRRVTEALLAQGHEVHVFTRPFAANAERPRRSRAVIHSIDEREHRSPAVREILDSYRENLAWSYALHDYLIRRGPELDLDVLEGPDFAAPLFFLQLRKIAEPESFPAPIVLRLHGLGREMRGYGHTDGFDRASYALDHAETFSVAAAQGLIGTSRFIRGLISRRLGLDESKIPFIPLPLGTASRPIPGRSPRERNRLLFIGRLEPRKGPDLLIEAVKPWLDRHPKLEVRLAGIDTLSQGGRSMLSHLRGLIPAQDRSRFRFLGPRSPREIERELRSCALMVVPSRFDNLPYVCLEAIAAGCPVISTDSCGLPEILRHGRSGLICKPRAASLSKALGRFFSMTRRKRAAMSSAARVEARRLCAPEIVARKQASFYRDVIRRKERTRLPRFFPFRDRVSARLAARPRAARSSKPGTVAVIGARLAAAAKNAAARAASADYLVFLREGEKPDRDFLHRAAKALDSNPELGFISPWPRGGAPLIFEFPWSLVERMAPVSSMVRRRAFEDAGGFAPGRDLYVSICERGWGGIPLVDALRPGAAPAGGPKARPTRGNARLLRRFRKDVALLSASIARSKKAATFDMKKARLALALWKESLRQAYDE
jgi:glycosyltransferase involved in cell wall biosynthesis